MGIFSRFKDIVTSNLNTMLDHAEDPEKLIRLMLCEMEETLVELKAGCASTMAESAMARRNMEQALAEADEWERRAELALRAGRDDMAREALAERLRAQEHGKAMEKELAGFDELILKCQDDIRLLEERILHTRDRQRLLLERHNQAQVRRQAREQVRAADSAAVMFRFDSLEQRIARMENEAELAYIPRQKHSDFHTLERDAAVTEQLEALRRKIQS